MKLIRRLLRPVKVSAATEPNPPVRGDGAPAKATRTLRLPAQGAAAPERQRRRLTVIGMVFAAGFLVTAGRAVEVSMAGSGPEAAVRTVDVAARRAMLVDRDGEILAATLDFHTVFADPHYVWNAREVVEQ